MQVESGEKDKRKANPSERERGGRNEIECKREVSESMGRHQRISKRQKNSIETTQEKESDIKRSKKKTYENVVKTSNQNETKNNYWTYMRNEKPQLNTDRLGDIVYVSYTDMMKSSENYPKQCICWCVGEKQTKRLLPNMMKFQ